MGLLDNAKDFLDEVKDEAEERTGIDIDRDGQTGSSPEPEPDTGTDSSESSSSQSGDAGVDVDVSDEVQVDTDEGSTTFDTGGADGGSDGLVEVDPNDPTPNDERNDGVTVVDSSDSSSSSGSSGSSGSRRGDAGVDVEVAEETVVESSDPEKVQEARRNLPEDSDTRVELNNADPRDVRKFRKKQERRVEDRIGAVRDTPEGTQFTTSEGETVNRSEALNTLEAQEDRLEESLQSTTDNGGQDSFDIARENANVERAVEFNNPFAPENDFTDAVEVSTEGIEDFLTNPADQSLITGTEIMQGGQDIADNIVDDAVDVKRDFDRAVIDANPFTTFEPGAQQELREGATPEDAIESIGRGAATGGSQLPGLLIATPGATSNALEDDTPSLTEGAATGGELFVEEAESDPVGLVGEEIGEEISEKAVFGTAGAVIGKTAGRASSIAGSVPTPDFRNLGTVKGQATLSGGIRVVDNSLIPPEFVDNAGPAILEPEPDTLEPDVSLETTKEPTAETDTVDVSIFSDAPVIDADSITGGQVQDPITEIFSQPEAEVISETQVESNTDPIAEVFSRAEVQPELDRRFDPRFDTRPDQTLRLGLGERNQENLINDVFGTDEIEDQGTQFTPTLGGALFGETETVSRQQAAELNQQSFSGLGQRNVLQIEENGEDPDEKLQRQLGL